MRSELSTVSKEGKINFNLDVCFLCEVQGGGCVFMLKVKSTEGVYYGLWEQATEYKES